MDTKTLTYNTKASTLDGLTGRFDYRSPQTVSILVDAFKSKMLELYNTETPYDTQLCDLIETIGTEETTPDGNFAKRFMKEWKRRNALPPGDYKRLQYKPVTEAGAVIGDLHKQLYGAKPKLLYYRITNDIQNVLEDPNRDSGYGNPGSCWFAGREYSRSPRILEASDGAGILVGTAEPVNVDNGIGRCWLVNGRDGLVIFNPYIEIDGVNRDKSRAFGFFTELLVKIVGYVNVGFNKYVKPGDPPEAEPCHFEKVYFNGLPRHGLYINDNRGEIFSPAENPRPGDCFEEDDGDYYTSDNCGCVIDENEVYYSPNGEPLCEDCYDEYCTTCERCGDTIWRDDAYCDEYGTYCEYCYDRTHTTCDRCEETINTQYEDANETPDGTVLCDNCYTDYLREQEERERIEQESQDEGRRSQA